MPDKLTNTWVSTPDGLNWEYLDGSGKTVARVSDFYDGMGWDIQSFGSFTVLSTSCYSLDEAKAVGEGWVREAESKRTPNV